MSEMATPTPPSTAAQVSATLKRVENTGSAPVMVTASASGGARPHSAARTPRTSSNAVAMAILPVRVIVPGLPTKVYTTRTGGVGAWARHLSPRRTIADMLRSERVERKHMTWQIGDVRVTKIVELETTGGSRFILPQATPEAVRPIAWLFPHFADATGRLKMSIHALVVEAPGRRIIIDTRLGNNKKERRIPTWNDRQGRFLDDLPAAGFPPATIDTVLCTHLHVDHVGWNTMLVNGAWVPTFPKARYLFGQVEYQHWSTQRTRSDMLPVFADSIKPIFDRGLAELVAWDHQICAEVKLIPTLGTPPGRRALYERPRGQPPHDSGCFPPPPLPVGAPRVNLGGRLRPRPPHGAPPAPAERARGRTGAGDRHALCRPYRRS